MYPILDTHCDTISKLLDLDLHLDKNNLHVDLLRMSKYPAYTQFFACFIDPTYKSCALERALLLIDRFYRELGKHESVQVCTDYKQITPGKINAFLSLEGGEPIESIAALRTLYRLGIRMVALTWNYSNHLASGVLEPDPERGVTEFGKQVLQEMERLGMIADVSHLNERSFWDVAKVVKGPIVASHSNARAICNHPRNLTDAQFLEIKKHNGCVGINLYPPFLTEHHKADISSVIAHIDHFMALGGEDYIGIGADFDGVDGLPEGIRGVEDIEKLVNELLKIGYSEEQVQKIAYKNFQRVLKICL